MIEKCKDMNTEEMEPEVLSPIDQKMNVLEESIDDTRTNVDALRDLLNPVLLPDIDGEDKESSFDELQNNGCLLEGRIDKLYLKINVINDIVIQCRARLRI